MEGYNISWPVRGNKLSYDKDTHSDFLMLELDTEWKLKYLCQQKSNPAFIEFHRKSPAGQKLISGTLELHENDQCLLQKKFICLMDDCCLSTSIDAQFSPNALKSYKMLLLKAEIFFSDTVESSLDLTDMVHITKTDLLSLDRLSKDMKKLISEKSPFADVTLKCGDVSISAHKSILSARSSVFEALFRCPMKEDAQKKVVINEYASTIQALVKYIYTGKTDSTKADILLRMAHEYQIESLGSSCSELMMHALSMESVVTFLIFGDVFSSDLKNFAIDFVCKQCDNYSALEETSDWSILKKYKPALAMEVFSAIVKFQEQKLKTYF